MRYPVVEVEWDDACLRSGSAQAEKAVREGLTRRHTVGYLVGRTKRQVAVAMTDDLDGSVDDVLTVPFAWVRKVRYLRKGRKK